MGRVSAATKGREILKLKDIFPTFNLMDYNLSILKNLNFYASDVDDNKKKKAWAIAYWIQEGRETKGLTKLSDGYFATAGAVAHMIMHRDIALDARELRYMSKQYHALSAMMVCDEDEDGVDKTTVRAIAESKEKAKEDKARAEFMTHLGEFEGGIDAFFEDRTFDAKNYLIRNSVKPAVTKQIAAVYKPLLKEVIAALSGKDAQLSEGYSNLTPRQLKKFGEHVASIVSSCEVASAITKATRKPRAKKVKSPVDLVKDVKYLQTDELSNLTSIHPAKTVNAKEVWVYNAKTRRLFKYVPLNGMTLSIKGTTLINIDQEKSGGKIIRKPDLQLKGMQDMTSRPTNKVFNDIRSTMSRATGRLNEETLIISAF